jgi:hydroxyacylglutathione hydrolase
MKLEKDLYAYIWKSMAENNSNSYVIGGEVPVVIDPGHLHLVKGLIKQMEKDGLRPKEIQAVIATHGHPDHFEAVSTFAQEGAKVGLHRDEETFLQEAGRQFYAAFGNEMPEIHIDFYLKEGELKLGDKIFQVLQTPGHSPGSISLYWPEKKALFTGDVVFPMGVGRTDFPGGNGMLLRDSIERLARLDAEWLLAGHGEVIRGRADILRNFSYIRSTYFDYL